MAGLIDWSTEYDIFDKGYIEDPFGIWDELRGTCPIAHTDKWGGSWLPTTYDIVTKMAREPEKFSSREVLVVPPAFPRRRGFIFLCREGGRGSVFLGRGS